MNTMSTTKTNTTGNGESQQPALDKTGQFVVFASDAKNLSTDTSGLSAIYLKNTQTGDLKLISNDKYGIAANTASLNPTISGDGKYVIFESTAVVSTDFNNSILFPSFSDFDSRSQNNKGGVFNLFLKNTSTNDLTLVTPNFGDGDSTNAEITPDGRSVVFQSLAANFMNSYANGAFGIYVEDLQTKTLKLVSSDASGTIGNRASVNPSVSSDGLKVAFASDADNFLGFNNVTMNLNATPWLPLASLELNNISVSVPIDNNANRDVFVKNVNTGTIQLVSANYKGSTANGVSDQPNINADGTKVVFRSFATNLIANLIDVLRDGSSYVYLKDLNTNTLTQIDLLSDNQLPNGSSWNPQLSPDGKFVAFISDSTNLIFNDNNGVADVFLKNLSTGELNKISDDSIGIGNVIDFSFSGDSSMLAYSRLSGLEDNATINISSVVINSNVSHTGQVLINGTAKQGQTLTASNTLADADGMGELYYQWLSNGIPLSGETSSTHVISANDIGAPISVKVNFTDKKGNYEVETSSPVTPSFSPIDYSLSVDHVEVYEDGETVVTFTLDLSHPSNVDMIIPFTLSGTAIKGKDYDGELTETSSFKILEGETNSSLSFIAKTDFIVEKDEALILTLDQPSDGGKVFNNDLSVTIHNIYEGTNKGDKWTGTAQNDMAFGNSGNDTLSAGAGDDTIVGGVGSDKLTGGKGRDTFSFSQADFFTSNSSGALSFNKSNDTITDFSLLDGDVLDFGDMGSLSFFATLSDAKTDEANLFYVKGTGKIYFNIDTTGTHYNPMLIITLTGKPAVNVDLTDWNYPA